MLLCRGLVVSVLALTAPHRGDHAAVELPDGERRTVRLHVAPETLRLHWREAIVVGRASLTDFRRMTGLAFGNLAFAPEVWGQVKSMVGGYESLRDRLVEHFSALDDHAPAIWAQYSESARRIAEMASRGRIDCSPDSPATHRNNKAMAQRTVMFGPRRLICEWHTKLEPHQNRIHFAVDGQTVYVGVLAAHLLT
jgi:hypothetical protein